MKPRERERERDGVGREKREKKDRQNLIDIFRIASDSWSRKVHSHRILTVHVYFIDLTAIPCPEVSDVTGIVRSD